MFPCLCVQFQKREFKVKTTSPTLTNGHLASEKNQRSNSGCLASQIWKDFNSRLIAVKAFKGVVVSRSSLHRFYFMDEKGATLTQCVCGSNCFSKLAPKTFLELLCKTYVRPHIYSALLKRSRMNLWEDATFGRNSLGGLGGGGVVMCNGSYWAPFQIEVEAYNDMNYTRCI